MSNYENKSYTKKNCEVVDNNYNVNKSNIEFIFLFPKKLLSPAYSTTTMQVGVKNLQKKQKKDTVCHLEIDVPSWLKNKLQYGMNGWLLRVELQYGMAGC